MPTDNTNNNQNNIVDFIKAILALVQPQENLISPTSESETLNDPGKLFYVAQNQANEQAARQYNQGISQGTIPTPTPYPAFKYHPDVANAPATMPTPTPIPMPSSGSYYRWTPEWAKPVLDNLEKMYKVPTGLLSSQIWHESGFNSGARGYNLDKVDPKKILSTDRGIAQINDRWHPEISNKQADDSNFALDWMARTMSEKYKRLGSWEKALSEYNTGQPDSPRGRKYANAVLQSMPKPTPSPISMPNKQVYGGR